MGKRRTKRLPPRADGTPRAPRVNYRFPAETLAQLRWLADTLDESETAILCAAVDDLTRRHARRLGVPPLPPGTPPGPGRPPRTPPLDTDTPPASD